MSDWDLYKQTCFLMAQPLAPELSFAVITAHNPQGDKVSDTYNRLLDYRLQQDIVRLNVPYRELWGSAPDLSHREKSWAVLADKSIMLTLARAYQQNAIYWVDANQLYLTPCLLKDQSEEHIGTFSQRVIVSA
ncbi:MULTISPECIES: DUF3293 domain-containing protein [Corallincola]|uniref:DUF3293 domain-containing protein n=2 Tax=Corallincola TaxID=1775176 RepID=A0A368NP32_9GAMM|nr:MULTISPECIES: DUF3293 domain-containing protein [Corallincola]RCU51643.1 DUF3293 domain-containing protein [Corallincola holothuriorum]TAA47144.1 DUF3293 domain-containing protein [Corallincola spongiicola]